MDYHNPDVVRTMHCCQIGAAVFHLWWLPSGNGPTAAVTRRALNSTWLASWKVSSDLREKCTSHHNRYTAIDVPTSNLQQPETCEG